MKRRIIALIGAVILLLSNMMLLVVPASAEEGDDSETITSWSIGGGSTEREIQKGYYKLIKKVVVGPSSQFDNAVTSGGYGHYACSAKCTDKNVSAYHDGEHLTSCYGESVTINIDIEEPPTYISDGQEIKLKVSPSFSASEPHDSLMFYTCQIHVDYSYGGYNADGGFEDSNGKTRLGIDRTWQYDDYYGASGLGNHFFVIESDNYLRHTFYSRGSKLWVRIGFGHGRGEDGIDTYYFYEWVNGKDAETDFENKDKKDDKDDGYWELYDISVPEQTENISVNKQFSDSVHTVTTFEDGKASSCFTALKDVYNNSGDIIMRKDDTASASLVYSPPEKKYYPGQTYSIDISAASDYITRESPLMDVFVGIKAGVVANSGTVYTDKTNEEAINRSSTRTLYSYEGGNYGEYVGSSKKSPVNSGTLTGLIPYRNKSGDTDDDSMWIYVNISDSDTDGNLRLKGGSIIYKYKWVKGKIKGTSGIDDENDGEGDKGRKDRKDKDNQSEQSILQLIETNASDRPGEDNGRSIIPAIVIGISTAGAAAAAGAVAAGNKQNNNKNKDDTTYKMYIRKDFGDTIEMKAKPVRVYGRIESSKGGTASDEPGLTSKIEIYSETNGVSVNNIGIVSGAKCAEIQIPDNKESITECIIVFSYTGKGGVFKEKVKFKVTGQKHIEFIHIQDDGQIKVMAVDERNYRSLFGHQFKINKYIRLANFGEDAEDVKAIPPAGSGVSVNVTRTEPFTYCLAISENYKYTQFGQFPFDVKIDITAYNKGEIEAKAVLTLKMYPYGIYIDTRDLDRNLVKEDHIEVNVFEFVDDKMLKFKPTMFRICYATWGDEDDREVDVREVTKDNPRFSVLPQNEESEKILKKFEYGLYVDQEKTPYALTLEPRRGLFQRDPNAKFLYKIKIERDCKRALGETGPDYEGSFMIRLLGKLDDDKTYERRKEIDEIYHIIALNKMSDNYSVQQLILHLDKMPDDVIKKSRRWIYDLSADLQSEEFANRQLEAEYWEYGIRAAGNIRWFDDLAFSYMVKYIAMYYKVDPDIAEAIITPLKDILLDSFGEWTAKLYWGSGNEDFSFWNQVVEKAEGSLSTILWGQIGGDNVSTKKLVTCLILASIANVSKNAYLNYQNYKKDNKEINSSFYWKVCRDVLKDFSVTILKDKITGYIKGKAFENDTANKLIEKNYKSILENSTKETTKPIWEFLMKRGGSLLVKNENAAEGILKEINKKLFQEFAIDTGVDNAVNGAANFVEAFIEDKEEFEIPIINDSLSVTITMNKFTLKNIIACQKIESLRMERAVETLGKCSIMLPEEFAYTHRQDVIEFYSRLGYSEEVSFLKYAEHHSPVNSEAFPTGAVRPTLDIGTTIHNVVK